MACRVFTEEEESKIERSSGGGRRARVSTYSMYVPNNIRPEWYETQQRRPFLPFPRKRSAMIFSDGISDIVSWVNESDHFVVTIGTDTRKQRSTALHR